MAIDGQGLPRFRHLFGRSQIQAGRRRSDALEEFRRARRIDLRSLITDVIVSPWAEAEQVSG